MPARSKTLRRRLLLPALALASLAGVGAMPFRYAEDQAPAIVNPLFTTSMSETRVNELLFEGLFTDDKELRTVPQLAESAELATDRLSMRIRLRDDVTWHDGRQFTASDVIFTVKALQDKGTLSTESGRVAWIKDAVAEDDHTVRLVFVRPEANPEEKLYFKILPEHIFAGTAIKRSDPFRTHPVGTGPYRFVKYGDDNSISMARYDQHRAPASLPEMVMREVSDKNYQAKLLLYESVEALVRVLPRDLATLQNNRKVTLYPYQTNSWWYLGFNMKRAPFDDLAVRTAISDLVDPQSLLDPVGTGELVTGPFVPSSPFYNHDVPAYKADPEAAKAALAADGWTQDAGGIWTKGGKPLSLRITAYRSLETAQEVVINLQSRLQSAGIKAEVDFLDDAAWKAQIWRDHNFDVILSQWTFDRNEDVREQLHSQGSRNFMGYANPTVDALLDRARDAVDPQDKKTTLREVHRVVHDDAPMVFLWTLDSYSAMTSKVKGVTVHPFYFFTWVKDWRTL